MTIRGTARRMRSAIAATALFLLSSRSAAVGISAISRAMAVEGPRSGFAFMGDFSDCHPQIAVVTAQDVGGIRGPEPEAEKDGDLQVAVRLFDEACRILRRATDDLANDHRGAPLELGVAGPHVHHQPAID